jgi:hypothetical protein
MPKFGDDSCSQILLPGEILTLTLDGKPVEISGYAGTLWITVEGDSDDHVLRAGERFESGPEGLLAIQVLSSLPAAFSVKPARGPSSPRCAAAPLAFR